MHIRQYLDFHVAWSFQELLQIDGGIAEGVLGFGLGNLHRFQQGGFRVHHLHAATTTAGSGLDHHRVADLLRQLEGTLVVVRQRAVGAGYGRYACLFHGFDGGDLVTHQANGFRPGADEAEAAFLDLLGKVGVLCQKAVARVDAHGIGHLSSADDGGNVQVAFCWAVRANADRFVCKAHVHQVAVDLRVHGNRLDAQLLARAENAQGNFTAVCDQNFF